MRRLDLSRNYGWMLILLMGLTSFSLNMHAEDQKETGHKDKPLPFAYSSAAIAPQIKLKVVIKKITITDYPQKDPTLKPPAEPELAPIFTLNSDHPDFKSLAYKVMMQSKINQTYSLKKFFENKPKIKPTDESAGSPDVKPNFTEILVEFSDGTSFKIGEYPFYNLTAPFDELVNLVRKEGQKSFKSA